MERENDESRFRFRLIVVVDDGAHRSDSPTLLPKLGGQRNLCDASDSKAEDFDDPQSNRRCEEFREKEGSEGSRRMCGEGARDVVDPEGVIGLD